MARTFVSCWRCLHIALLVSGAPSSCRAWRREENFRVKLWTWKSQAQDIHAVTERLLREAKEGDHDAIAACQVGAQRGLPDVLPQESEWAVVSHRESLGEMEVEASDDPQRVALTILVRKSMGGVALPSTHKPEMWMNTTTTDLVSALKSAPFTSYIAGVRSFANALPSKVGSVAAALLVDRTRSRSATSLGFVCTSINPQASEEGKQVAELASLVSPRNLESALAGGMGEDSNFKLDVVMAMGSLNFRFDYSSAKDENGHVNEAALHQLLYRAGGRGAGDFEQGDPLKFEDAAASSQLREHPELAGLACNRPYYHYMPAATRYQPPSCALLDVLKTGGSSTEFFAPVLKACYLPDGVTTWEPTHRAESPLPGWPERFCYVRGGEGSGIDVQLLSDDAWQVDADSLHLAVVATLNVFQPRSYCHTATRGSLRYRRPDPAPLPQQPAIFSAGEQLVLEGDCPEGARLLDADRLLECAGLARELLPPRLTWPCRRPCATRPIVNNADATWHSVLHDVVKPIASSEVPLLDIDDLLDFPVTEEYFAGDALHFKCHSRSRPLQGQPLDYHCDDEGLWRSATSGDRQDYSGANFSCQFFCEAPSPEELLSRTGLQITEVSLDGSDLPHADGDMLMFSCEAPQVLDGPNVLTCHARDGGYSDLPRCLDPVCSEPDLSDRPQLRQVRALPRFGAAVVQGMPGDTLEYECDPGYSMIGEASVVCDELLGDYGTLPTCRRSCGHAPVEVGAIASREGELIWEGETVSYMCAEGYQTRGSVVEFGELFLYYVTCRGGKFHGHTPKCTALCRVPKAPKYGFVDVDSEVGEGSTPKLPRASLYGYVDIDSEVVEGQSISFACQRDYRLFGQPSSTCLATRAFSAPLPQCFRAARVILDGVSWEGPEASEAFKGANRPDLINMLGPHERLKFKVFPKKLLAPDVIGNFDKFKGYIAKQKIAMPFGGKAEPMVLMMNEAYDAWMHVEVCKASRSFLSRSRCDSLALSPVEPLTQEEATCEQCLGNIFEEAAENAGNGAETTTRSVRFNLNVPSYKATDSGSSAFGTATMQIRLSIQIF